MSRLQGSSSGSSSASHLPSASPAQCESHIWAPSKADSTMPLLPLTRDVSEKRWAAHPTSPGASLPRPSHGDDPLGGVGEMRVSTSGPFFPRGRTQKLRICLRTVTLCPVSWEPPGISLGLSDLLTRAKTVKPGKHGRHHIILPALPGLVEMAFAM